MSRRLELTGRRFGRWLVIGFHRTRDQHTMWRCLCDCGKRRSVLGKDLTIGKSRSCGCFRGIHQGSSTGEYRIWIAMKVRCGNPKAPHWQDYGGRGIRVCPRWKNSFSSFFADMGPRPEGTWIERRKNDVGYRPSNCLWATPKQQAQNRRPRRK